MATANPDVEEHVDNSSFDGHCATTSTINTAVKGQTLSEKKDGCGCVSEIGGQESPSSSEAVQKRIYPDLTALKEGNVSETRKEYRQIGCAPAKEDSSVNQFDSDNLVFSDIEQSHQRHESEVKNTNVYSAEFSDTSENVDIESSLKFDNSDGPLDASWSKAQIENPIVCSFTTNRHREYESLSTGQTPEENEILQSGCSHETWSENYIPKHAPGRAVRIADSEGDKIDPNKNQHLEDASGNSKRKISNDKKTQAVGSKRNERKHRGIDQNWKTNDDDLFEEAETKYEYFWKNPSAFSQWGYSVFFIGSSKFTCAEQYMMYQKAVLFGDCAIANKILYEKSPRRIKALGRKVHGFSDEIWNANCLSIVKEANIAKFSQNRHLKQALFDTYPKLLVEASPLDTIWGIGLAAEDPAAWDERTWCGKNYLGYVLTEVRDELMADAKCIADSDKKIYLPDLVKQMTKKKEKVYEPEACEGGTPV